jgi:hypothetical protein
VAAVGAAVGVAVGNELPNIKEAAAAVAAGNELPKLGGTTASAEDAGWALLMLPSLDVDGAPKLDPAPLPNEKEALP